MHFKYNIDKANNLVYVRFSDTVNDNALLRAFNSIYADPDYTPVMDQCLDYSDVEQLSLSHQGIQNLVTLCENFNCLNTQWYTCIIAPDSLSYGYARMYQFLTKSSFEKVNVVRSQEAAMKLLSIKPDSSAYLAEKAKHKTLQVW